MIEERAVITDADGEAVSFRIMATGACDECSLREACFRNDGAIRISRERIALCGAGSDELPARGSEVALRIPQTSVLGLTAVVYGVPLLAFLAGVLSGQLALFPGLAEGARALASFGLGLGALAAAGLGTLFTDRSLSRRLRYEIDT